MRSSPYSRRARRHIKPKSGQSFDDAIKEASDKLKRIAEEGFTADEVEDIYIQYEARQKRSKDETAQNPNKHYKIILTSLLYIEHRHSLITTITTHESNL